jgi:hypothetical protein
MLRPTSAVFHRAQQRRQSRGWFEQVGEGVAIEHGVFGY